jgi:hypothetical protein
MFHEWGAGSVEGEDANEKSGVVVAEGVEEAER